MCVCETERERERRERGREGGEREGGHTMEGTVGDVSVREGLNVTLGNCDGVADAYGYNGERGSSHGHETGVEVTLEHSPSWNLLSARPSILFGSIEVLHDAERPKHWRVPLRALGSP